MKRLRVFHSVCLILLTVAGLASILATGGSGGGSSSSSTDNTGSVAVMVTDGPADAYDSITIYIKEVSLIPAEGRGNGGHALIFKSDDPKGCPVNLLDYREDDFLLTLKENVPSGWYEKIRLRIGDIESTGGECDLSPDPDMIKLPSGKIDLNPRGEFYVSPGETLGIRLDFDANKSINFHPTGNTGRCIFRPVVFVDIWSRMGAEQCPKIVKGIIDELTQTDSTTSGFWLDLPGKGHRLEIVLEENVRIFDAYGEPGSPQDFEEGRKVWVRGTLDEGRLNASMVVIGDILMVEGMTNSVVDDVGLFYFIPDEGEELVTDGDELFVQLYDESLVLIGCDQEVPSEVIQAGMRAWIVGKFATAEQLLRASVVFLSSEGLEVSGRIVSATLGEGGRYITIEPDDGLKIEVFVSNGTPVYLEEDGLLPNDLLCVGKRVRVQLDPSALDPEAEIVFVEFEDISGRVDSVMGIGEVKVMTVDNIPVTIQPDATIWYQSEANQTEKDFSFIEVGQEVRVFGTSDCEDGFLGFTILVVRLAPQS